MGKETGREEGRYPGLVGWLEGSGTDGGMAGGSGASGGLGGMPGGMDGDAGFFCGGFCGYGGTDGGGWGIEVTGPSKTPFSCKKLSLDNILAGAGAASSPTDYPPGSRAPSPVRL